MRLEQRSYQGELRALEGEEGTNKMPALRFEGYAAMYDSPSEDLGGFTERIAPGAFRSAISGEDDVRALLNHDPNYVLGRLRAGTLRLTDDERGLRFEVDAPDVGWAHDLYESVRRGDIDQCSFRFECRKDEWHTGENGGEERTLLDVGLSDVSIVTFPAYAATSASVRSAADILAAHARDEPKRTQDNKRKQLELKEKEWKI